MESRRWEEIQVLFHEAALRPEFERVSYLESACGPDLTLMTRVLHMLRIDSAGTSLLDRPLPELAYVGVGTPHGFISSREFGPYRLKHILGEGGMGVVWLATHLEAGNSVAIKFLPDAGLSPARRDRFASEIRTLAKLKHPFIARLYDAGALPDGTPWFAMEYVEGAHLTEYCRKAPARLEDLLRLFRSICQAVQYAHGHEIIHRDLKPTNILVEPDGTPKLLDFGIAKNLVYIGEQIESRTHAAVRFMSRDYAAPEWVREGIAGPYTDVYSLGVILYEMLTRRLPLDSVNSPTAGKQPAKPSVVATELSGIGKSQWHELDDLCLKALHWDAAQRYQSIEALIRDIDHFRNREPLEARRGTFRYRARKFVGRNRAAILASSLGLLLLLCLAVWFTVRLTKSRDTALAEAARREKIQSFMLNLFQGEDKEAGPSEDLRVIALIDRGVKEAQKLNNDPVVQAELYQTLGTMYQKLGKFDKSRPLLETALRERESQPDKNYKAITDNLIAIALLCSDQGDWQAGQGAARRALTTIYAHEPKNKLLVSKANSALGHVLVESGKHAEAIPILSQALQVQSAQEPQSPELAWTLSALADAQMFLGNYSASRSLNERALAIDRHVYGNADPQVGEVLHRLAGLYEMWGRYSEAEGYDRQALQIVESWYGKDHPQTARMMTALAGTLIYENRYDEADRLLNSALPIQRRAFGEMHPQIAYVLNFVASVANKRGDFAKAEAAFQRVSEIYRSAYGDGDYRVAVALGNLASVYMKEKQYRRAEQLLREVVQRFTKALSADNANTAMAEIRLGRTLLYERRYREAEEQTLTGYQILVKQSSSESGFIQGARHDLAAIYTALHQPDRAQQFQDSSLNLRTQPQNR